jgi:hypothetical protein
MSNLETLPCSRCGKMCLSSTMTICIHFDQEECLGKFCQDCVNWVILALQGVKQ